MLDRDLAAELGCNQLDLVVGERLGRGLHRPHVHQHLDDLRHPDAERLGEVAHRDAGLDGDGTGRLDGLALLARLPLRGTVAGALALPRAGTAAAAFDDDAAPALRAAPAGPDRSVRLSVGHVYVKCRGV